MKNTTALEIIKNLKNDLDSVYYQPAHPTLEDHEYLQNKNYSINSLTYYDGRIINVYNDKVKVKGVKFQNFLEISFCDKDIFPYTIVIIDHFIPKEFQKFNMDFYNGDEGFHVVIETPEDILNINNDYLYIPDKNINDNFIDHELHNLLKSIYNIFNQNREGDYIKYLVRIIL